MTELGVDVVVDVKAENGKLGKTGGELEFLGADFLGRCVRGDVDAGMGRVGIRR